MTRNIKKDKKRDSIGVLVQRKVEKSLTRVSWLKANQTVEFF